MKPDFHNLGELGLDYKDLLTYITIRSFYNSNSKYCYPGYRAISKLSGLSPYFIGKSVKRLNEAGILTVWKVGKLRKANWYMFDNAAGLNKISYELLKDSDLSSNEKSVLILLSEYCKHGYCAESIADIADKAGVSFKVLNQHYQALRLKGYISESMHEDCLSGTLTKHFALTNMLQWDMRQYTPACPKVEDSPIEKVLNIIQDHMRLRVMAARQ